jgi:uncharacterized membrane protein YraQ (UPF0718 family)
VPVASHIHRVVQFWRNYVSLCLNKPAVPGLAAERLMHEFIAIFLALVVETVPFLLAGVLIAEAGGPLFMRVLDRAAFRQPVVAVVAGTSAGALLPMCDCGSRPLANRLCNRGLREAGLTVLVAAPVINPIVIVTTWLAFRDVELVVLRLATVFVVTVAVVAVLRLVRGDLALPQRSEIEDGHAAPFAARVLIEFFELFAFLVAGCALAAAMQVYLDRDVLISTPGIYFSIVALMSLAFILSICSSVDAFVAAGLGAALGTGPLLAFMAFGPIMNLKSIPLYMRLFQPITLVFLAIISAQVVFGVAVIAELRDW